MTSNIEIMGFGFTAICISFSMISLIRALVANSMLLKHLKQNHYSAWKQFIGETDTEMIRHICLTPLNSKNSYHYFIFKSDEEFDDTQVGIYKRRVRNGAYGFVFNGVASFIGFGLTGFLLTYWS